MMVSTGSKGRILSNLGFPDLRSAEDLGISEGLLACFGGLLCRQKFVGRVFLPRVRVLKLRETRHTHQCKSMKGFYF